MQSVRADAAGKAAQFAMKELGEIRLVTLEEIVLEKLQEMENSHAPKDQVMIRILTIGYHAIRCDREDRSDSEAAERN